MERERLYKQTNIHFYVIDTKSYVLASFPLPQNCAGICEGIRLSKFVEMETVCNIFQRGIKMWCHLCSAFQSSLIYFRASLNCLFD